MKNLDDKVKSMMEKSQNKIANGTIQVDLGTFMQNVWEGRLKQNQ